MRCVPEDSLALREITANMFRKSDRINISEQLSDGVGVSWPGLPGNTVAEKRPKTATLTPQSINKFYVDTWHKVGCNWRQPSFIYQNVDHNYR
jgi:hypothetical protein